MVFILNANLAYTQEDNKEAIATAINNECKTKYDNLQDMKNAIPYLENIVATSSPETSLTYDKAQCVLKNLKTYGELSNDQVVIAPALPDSPAPFSPGSETGLDTALLDRQIERLGELDEITQDDIDLSFFILIEDCIKGDSNNDSVIMGCQVAVYTALAIDIEEKLGIDMERDNAFDGKPPQIIE